MIIVILTSTSGRGKVQIFVLLHEDYVWRTITIRNKHFSSVVIELLLESQTRTY